MKKEYQPIEFEIIFFDAEDVIVTSDNELPEDPNPA